MKQPDAFEEAVEREYQKWLKGPQENGRISVANAVLRAHHKKVVRMVKRVSEAYATGDLLEPSAAENLRNDILAKLKAMERKS